MIRRPSAVPQKKKIPREGYCAVRTAVDQVSDWVRVRTWCQRFRVNRTISIVDLSVHLFSTAVLKVSKNKNKKKHTLYHSRYGTWVSLRTKKRETVTREDFFFVYVSTFHQSPIATSRLLATSIATPHSVPGTRTYRVQRTCRIKEDRGLVLWIVTAYAFITSTKKNSSNCTRPVLSCVCSFLPIDRQHTQSVSVSLFT